VTAYAATAAILIVGSIALRDSTWQGNVELHTLMELAATLLAMNVGVLALVRFYSQKDNTFLFIGSGFLGTGLLDAYHTVVTSSYFGTYFPSAPVSLIPWSWLASRLFLSIACVLSWYFWKREKTLGAIDQRLVYCGFSVLTIASFLFFATVPLPTGYLPWMPIGRPQELIPAMLFLVALVGYLRKGRWRSEPFEHWMVLSLIVNFLTQAMFMSSSEHLYDASFDAAHLLKMTSYNCVLIGLLASMYRLFWMSISEPIMIFERASLVDVNLPMARLFGYTQEEMLALDLDALSAVNEAHGRSGLKALLEKPLSGQRETFEWRCRAADGHVFWAGVDIQRAAFGDHGTLLLRAHDITDRKDAEHRLWEEQKFTAAMIDSMPGYFVLINRAGRMVRWNDNLRQLTGLTDEQLRDFDVLAAVAESDRDRAGIVLKGAFVREFPPIELGIANGGNVRTVRWSGQVVTGKGQRYLLALGIDVTETRAAEQRLQKSEDRFRTIFASVSDGIIVHDCRTGAFIDVNSRVCEIFGYSRDELLRLNLGDLSSGVPPYTLAEIAPLMAGVTSTAITFEWQCRARDGHLFWIEISVRRAAFGGQDILLSTTRDITERRRANEQIHKMARHDSLTGLANRRVFVETLNQTIIRANSTNTSFAVLYIDLDHFKDVNDTLGHPVGDLLLQTVAERLLASVRKGDTVARFGGDEFAIILTDILEPADAATASERIIHAMRTCNQDEAVKVAGDVADKLVKALAEPISIDNNQINSGTTVGIAVYGRDSPDAETMLSRADMALYHAKAEGRGTYRFFTESMDTEVRARVSVSAELRGAISSGQLFLLYHPQVEIDTGHIVGLESLVRWRHPERGVLAPGRFIPIAERSGLIMPLAHWVLRESCRQARIWLDARIAPPLVSINLSVLQLRRPLALERDIAAAMAEFNLPATILELELTESVLMEASRDHNDLLIRLRKMGHRIAIDDFGSGYSSLDYLRRYPVDRIKIAQSFIADIGSVAGNDAIVRAALGLARELSIEVVVEGVETRAQLELLKSWGCRIVQGFYYARPLPAPEIGELLRLDRGGSAFEGLDPTTLSPGSIGRLRRAAHPHSGGLVTRQNEEISMTLSE
jgi:diguanylate cyclase (GGDEF)-like protein/PAS domain S-box-containing protein